MDPFMLQEIASGGRERLTSARSSDRWHGAPRHVGMLRMTFAGETTLIVDQRTVEASYIESGQECWTRGFEA